jgi:hypothetical protein
MPHASGIVAFVAAESAVMRRVRDVLRDWVAYGLAQPFLWIDQADVDVHRPLAEVIATLVGETSAPRVRLQDHLADRHSIGTLRLVPLSTMGAAPATVDRAVAGYLYTGLDGTRAGRISPLHCVLTRHGEGGWHPGGGWTGWHTLVIAPEDSWTPASTATDLTYAHPDGEFYGHVAAALSGITGLWAGMTEAPFDAEQPGALMRPLVTRAFLRRLDASATTAALRLSLTDVSAGLPRPRHGPSLCEYSRSPDSAAARMAQAVLDHHQGLLATRREPADAGGPQRLGPWAALGMFFRFLGTALRRAPWAVGDEIRVQTAAVMGQAVQKALFGDTDSRYQVVTADMSGRSPDAEELTAGAEEIARRVKAAVPDLDQTAPSTAPFWQDFVDGALTLADGGERGPQIPPILVGSVPAVVTDPANLTPAPANRFEVPTAMVGAMGTTHLDAADVRSHQHLAQRLATASAGNVQLAQVAERLQAWRAEIGRAYTSVVGNRLAGELHDRTAAMREQAEELRNTMSAAGEPAAGRRDQLNVLKVLAGLVIGWILIAVAVAVAVDHGWTSTRNTMIAAACAALVWLIWLIVVLVGQQRRIFAALAARNAMLARHAAAIRNVGHAATELHVAAVLYQQYLAWTPILGTFLRQPFGPVVQPVVAPRLAGPLPRATGLGIAHPHPDQIDRATHELGRTVFASGWLSGLWSSFVADAPRRLGRAGLSLADDPGLLMRDEAGHARAPLRLWKQAVLAEGVTGAAGDELWAKACGRLRELGTVRMAETLFGDVEVIGQTGHGVAGRLDGARFLTQLTAALDDSRSYHFSTALFAPAAASQEDHRVDGTVLVGDEERTEHPPGVRRLASPAARGPDLDQFIVIVQASAPVPAEHLRLQEHRREERDAVRAPTDDMTDLGFPQF